MKVNCYLPYGFNAQMLSSAIIISFKHFGISFLSRLMAVMESNNKLISFHYSYLCIEHHRLSCSHVNCCIHIGLSSKIPLQHIILYIKSLKHSKPTFWPYKCWTYKYFILYILCCLKCSTREQYNFKICNNLNTWLNSDDIFLTYT